VYEGVCPGVGMHARALVDFVRCRHFSWRLLAPAPADCVPCIAYGGQISPLGALDARIHFPWRASSEWTK
jgi:hypothetical protein